MITYTMFIDFQSGLHEPIAQKYNEYTKCVEYADRLKNSIGLDNVHVSVWYGGKCYYSTDITVQLDF